MIIRHFQRASLQSAAQHPFYPAPSQKRSCSVTSNIKELTQLVGSRVILEVSGNTTFTGILYSVDADSGLVALRDNAMGHQADYNIVNAAHIVKFSSVGAPLSADKVEVLSSRVPAVPEETLQKYYARESQQVKKASEHVQRSIGDGVSKEAQQLFNLMSKALPCSWSHHTIVVGTSGSEDEVCITPPYTLATCSGKVKHSLDRVIQVLESLGVRQ